MTAHAPSRLPLYLAASYTLLALYGSLYPFSGWHDSGVGALDFLEAGWPRYTTGFDLAANLLAYLPLGFLWVAAMMGRLPPAVAWLAAALGAAGLSLGVEALQNFLPARVPSNLDLACNALGGLLGALAGLRWGGDLLDGGRLHAWRENRFRRGAVGDQGLMLLGLWLFTQLNPETFLFGNGNLRALLGIDAPLDFDVTRFTEFEMVTVAAQTFSIGLIGSHLAARQTRILPASLIASALVVKTAAIMVLMQGTRGFVWMTPGTLAGLSLGLGCWIVASRLSMPMRQALAAMALMLAAILANLMPDNPYLENTLSVWQQGHFLNFNGLTRLASSLWPFLALPWLMLSRSESP